MSKYRKLPVIIEATEWWRDGDHPKVEKRYKSIRVPVEHNCNLCGAEMYRHGWIDTLEGGYIVCPGDWIIKGVNGEHYPCKPDIFNKTYEKVEEGNE